MNPSSSRRRGRPPKVAAPVAEQLPESPPELPIPEDWRKGQLLNVRLGGPGWRITLLGEEYNPYAPERCLEFSNGGECQAFISGWYAREAHDPRAL